MLDKFLGANIALLLFFLVISIRIAAKLINRKVFGTNIYDFNLEKIWGRGEKEERKKINKYLAYNKARRRNIMNQIDESLRQIVKIQRMNANPRFESPTCFFLLIIFRFEFSNAKRISFNENFHQLGKFINARELKH